MTSSDAVFSGSIPQLYDRHFGAAMFGPHAADLARRLGDLRGGVVLEVAAGTGIATAALLEVLPESVALVATDLNQAMLDVAAAKPGMQRVTWRQADAAGLPFPDAAFDAVACQFGVMFFPDRRRAHAEARRVLRPGGRYVFNVWDGLANNPAAALIEATLAALYPERPPGFIGRTPMGHNDPARLRDDLAAAGFTACRIETVPATWHAASARDAAIGYCQGSPLRAEIEAADPAGPGRATEAAARALAARYGEGPIATAIQALVVETQA